MKPEQLAALTDEERQHLFLATLPSGVHPGRSDNRLRETLKAVIAKTLVALADTRIALEAKEARIAELESRLASLTPPDGARWVPAYPGVHNYGATMLDANGCPWTIPTPIEPLDTTAPAPARTDTQRLEFVLRELCVAAAHNLRHTWAPKDRAEVDAAMDAEEGSDGK